MQLGMGLTTSGGRSVAASRAASKSKNGRGVPKTTGAAPSRGGVPPFAIIIVCGLVVVVVQFHAAIVAQLHVGDHGPAIHRVEAAPYEDAIHPLFQKWEDGRAEQEAALTGVYAGKGRVFFDGSKVKKRPKPRSPAEPPGEGGEGECFPSISSLAKKDRKPTQGKRHMVDPPPSPIALVCCETTKGNVSIAVRPRWAPRGAKRFLDMVRASYFSSRVPLFRCVKNFLCQFGIAGQPGLGRAFGSVPDDPPWLPYGPKYWMNELGVPRFAQGYLAYAGAGPNTRSNQFILALVESRVGKG